MDADETPLNRIAPNVSHEVTTPLFDYTKIKISISIK